MTVNTTSLSNQLSRDLVKRQPEAPAADGSREGLPDFKNLLSESNQAYQEEVDKKRATMGEGGELRLGETTDDKAFREMLERVTGQPQRKHKNTLEKDDFLNLMVTQLKYQDPTKPTDHKDMATQLAQFNTVEQLSRANKSLDNMSKGQQELKADKLTEYLGREVTAKGSSIKTGSDSNLLPGTQGAFVLPTEAGSVTVSIKNSNNEVVKTLALGPTGAGEHRLNWDGTNNKGEKVGAGSFTFELVAQTIDGKKIETETHVTAEVTGVSQLAKGGQLETALGEVSTPNIVAVRKPGTAPESKSHKEDSTAKTSQVSQTAASKPAAPNTAATNPAENNIAQKTAARQYQQNSAIKDNNEKHPQA